jgi:hypothetical protein
MTSGTLFNDEYDKTNEEYNVWKKQKDDKELADYASSTTKTIDQMTPEEVFANQKFLKEYNDKQTLVNNSGANGNTQAENDI